MRFTVQCTMYIVNVVHQSYVVNKLHTSTMQRFRVCYISHSAYRLQFNFCTYTIIVHVLHTWYITVVIIDCLIAKILSHGDKHGRQLE